MYSRFQKKLLQALRLAAQPSPPHGNPGSLRVFRAGRNLLRLRLTKWALGQLLAVLGIGLSVAIFVAAAEEVARRRATSDAKPRFSIEVIAKSAEQAGRAKHTEIAAQPDAGALEKHVAPFLAAAKQFIAEVVIRLPAWAVPLLALLKVAGILAYLVQIPLTFLVARLDYELRWYMVTDRSLRIRQGVWKVSESTMSFANIQQVLVRQGPLQRLLGLADVIVQSAGGESGDSSEGHHASLGREERLHLGLFHCVTNATEIRDLILARLRGYRETGLGDPDEHVSVASEPASELPADSDPAVIAATHEMLAEARALRAALGAPR